MGNKKTMLFYVPNLSYVKRTEYKKGQNDEKTADSLEDILENKEEARSVIIFSFLPPNIFYTKSDAVVNFRIDNTMKNLFETSLFNIITSGEDLNETNYNSPVEIMKKAEGNSFLKVCKELYFLLSNHEYSFLDFVKQPDQYEGIIRKHLPNTAPYSTEEVKRKLKRASIWIYQRMVNLAFPFNLPSNAKVEINSKKYFSTLTVNSTEEFNKLNNYGKIKVVKQKPRNNRGRLYLVANSLV